MALVAAHGLLFVSDVWAQPAPEESPSKLTAGLVAGGIQLDWEAPRARAAEISGYQILRRRPDAGEARLLILVADTGSAAPPAIWTPARLHPASNISTGSKLGVATSSAVGPTTSA